jgi:hypothetical protein
MSTDTTHHAIDPEESRWTCKCGQVFELCERQSIPTTGRHDWRTSWSDFPDDHHYVEYLLVGMLLCVPVIVFLVEMYLYIEYLLS